MKTSVVIVARHEERDLERTIADVCSAYWPPTEVIVVDDGSHPVCGAEVCDRLRMYDEVRVIRGPTQLGAGPAKRFGCIEATGDVVIIMDSHLRLPEDYLDQVERAVEMYPDAIFCTTCRTFEGRVVGAGCRYDRKAVGFNRLWLSPGPADEIDTVPCMLGAFYVIPRHIGEAIDWINPFFYGWGCGEQDLSLKAWLFGYEVRRINSLVVEHRFDRGLRGVGNLSRWHGEFNQFVMAATLFERDVFEQIYAPHFREAFDKRAFERFCDFRDEIAAYGDELRAHRVHYDPDLPALCGYQVPTCDEQGKKVENILAGKAAQRFKTGHPLPQCGRKHLTRILDTLPTCGKMLEWGCGGSTNWFRERLKSTQSLVSIEHQVEWKEKIGGDIRLHELGIPTGRPEAEFLPDTFTTCLDPTATDYTIGVSKDEGPFDVIFVDGVLRNACLIRAVKALLKPGGFVFLHDAQREWYAEACELVKDDLDLDRMWRPCLDFKGPWLWEGRKTRAHD